MTQLSNNKDQQELAWQTTFVLSRDNLGWWCEYSKPPQRLLATVGPFDSRQEAIKYGSKRGWSRI